MSTPLFLLREVELGLSISDSSLLIVGMVNSIYTGKVNDDYKYREVATQDDFALFKKAL